MDFEQAWPLEIRKTLSYRRNLPKNAGLTLKETIFLAENGRNWPIFSFFEKSGLLIPSLDDGCERWSEEWGESEGWGY